MKGTKREFFPYLKPAETLLGQHSAKIVRVFAVHRLSDVSAISAVVQCRSHQARNPIRGRQLSSTELYQVFTVRYRPNILRIAGALFKPITEFVPDSPLEGDGFEPSVPVGQDPMPERIADNTVRPLSAWNVGWHENTPTWRVLLPHGWYRTARRSAAPTL